MRLDRTKPVHYEMGYAVLDNRPREPFLGTSVSIPSLDSIMQGLGISIITFGGPNMGGPAPTETTTEFEDVRTDVPKDEPVVSDPVETEVQPVDPQE